MEETRLSLWEEEKQYPLFFKEPVTPEFQKIRDKKKNEDSPSKFTMYEIYQMTHELIFNIVEGKPTFHAITRAFDTETLKLYFENSLDLLGPDDPKDYEDYIINVVGSAISMEIPVYPNDKMLEKELNEYYRKVIKEGFWAENEDGSKVKLKPTNSLHLSDIDFENLERLDVNKFLGPSVISIIREAIREELDHLTNAEKTLRLIDIGIDQLENLLMTENRNENDLQLCLTENPILFGLEYKRIIPKHKLGAEFIMDYALEKHSGHIAMVEIESSTLPLFTQKGNPSNYLIHAEQQVFDWLDWVDKHYGYERDKFENLYSPTGFVIIGRGNNLSSEFRKKILRRNKTFNGSIEILTYDDLLAKAKAIMGILKKGKHL